MVSFFRHLAFMAMALCALLSPCAARAQAAVPDSVIISWLTASEGTEIYELEGHASLRVRAVYPDSLSRTPSAWDDFVANWGVFDFTAPAFAWRFALGETDYFIEAIPTKYFVDSYTPFGRTVTEQRLNLTPAESARLAAIVLNCLQKGNNTYRYNYVLDNCSTRPLDAIEQALGQTVRFPDAQEYDKATFRSEMRRYHKDYPWYQFGIDMALGTDIDREITVRQRGFSPVEMQLLLDKAVIRDSVGQTVPLISSTSILNPQALQVQPPQSNSPWPSPLAVGLAMLTLTVVSVIVDQTRNKLTRWVDTVIFGLYGLAGSVVAFLVFISSHFATSPNLVLLWLNPLCFIGAVAVWFHGPAARKLLVLWHIVNIIALAALSTLFAIHIQEPNIAFWPLMGCSALRSINYLTLWRRNS